MSQAISCSPVLYVIGLYSCGKSDTQSLVHSLTEHWIWIGMLSALPGVLTRGLQITPPSPK